MADSIVGTWAYTMRGLIHALAFDNSKPEPPRPITSVNRGGPVRPEANTGEVVVLPAVSTVGLRYHELKSGEPTPDGGQIPLSANAIRLSLGLPTTPDGDVIPYVSRVEQNGFYPGTETGYMTFKQLADDKTIPIKSGEVSGKLRLNVAGHGDSDDWLEFEGQYKITLPVDGVASGAITLGFPTKKRLLWDYSIILVSDSEILITSGARLPRPGTLSGTMRRYTYSW